MAGAALARRQPLRSPGRAAAPRLMAPGRLRILCVGDCHFPFVDRRLLEGVYQAIRRLKPDAVVQMGDVYDLFNFFREPQREVLTAEDEVRAGRMAAQEFWAKVADLAPRAARYQILGNHDARLFKFLQRHAAKAEGAIRIAEEIHRDPAGELRARASKRMGPGEHEDIPLRILWEFDGVKTQPDDRTPLELDGIIFAHGWQTRLGSHVHYFAQNCVVGHTHRGGVHYARHRGSTTLWELNAGYIADKDSPAMRYTFSTVSQSVPGYGWVDEHGPRFVPL